MLAQKTLELNPRHPIFTSMLNLVDSVDLEAEEDSADETKASVARVSSWRLDVMADAAG